jgi:hypothetical protein
MSTFAQWVKDQVSRDDSIGYFARYYDTITPGKVSSVLGVLKVLEDNARQYSTQPDGMENPAWERARASSAAAIAGYHLAVKAFHGEDVAVPKAAAPETRDEGAAVPAGKPLPLAQVPGAGPQLTTDARGVIASRMESLEPMEPAATSPRRAGKYTGWPEERFNRMEDRQSQLAERLELAIAALANVEGLLDKILTALTGTAGEAMAQDEPPYGLPWQDWFDGADHDAAG